jgi:hypothetical protein
MNFVSLERDTKFSVSLNSFNTSGGYFGGSSVVGRFDCFGILGKLLEKDEEMKSMKQQLEMIQFQVQSLVAAIGNTKDQNQVNNMASTLYKSAILSVSGFENGDISKQ